MVQEQQPHHPPVTDDAALREREAAAGPDQSVANGVTLN